MGSSGWLQVSLQVDGEMAEAVAEVLARFAPGGVVTEQAVSSEGASPGSILTEPVLVYAFLPAEAALDDTIRRLREALYFLGRIRPLPEPEFQRVPDQDWTQAWKDRYQPLKIGDRLLILPAWMPPRPTDRAVILIDPGMAFGTGTHPSTQLCLEVLADLEQIPETVIDVGCGSGILAIGALKLGSGRALGVDTDPEAVQAAANNARLNGVDEQFELGVGSVAEIHEGKYGLEAAPLVLANILAPVLLRLLDIGLASLVHPGGLLVLSGMLLDQEAGIEEAVRTAGLGVKGRRRQGDWVALIAG